MANQKILLVGITGMLGSQIGTALLEKGYEVRALVRPGKKDSLGEWTARGVEVVEGDVLEPETLDPAAEGVEAIVSSVNNTPELILDGQQNLVEACKKHGIRRFIPSDFSCDYARIDFGDNPNIDMRKKFDERLRDAGVPFTQVAQGAFTEMLLTDFFGPFDEEKKTFRYWGDGKQLLDFTTIRDTALYVAATVLDSRTENKRLLVAGDQVTYEQIAAISQEILGRELDTASLGSVEDLKASIEKEKAAGADPMSYLGRQYQYIMTSGKGKNRPVMNDLYPEIKPTTVRQFLEQTLQA